MDQNRREFLGLAACAAGVAATGCATAILKNLEANELDVNAPKIVRKPRKKLSDVPGQMTFGF